MLHRNSKQMGVEIAAPPAFDKRKVATSRICFTEMLPRSYFWLHNRYTDSPVMAHCHFLCCDKR